MYSLGEMQSTASGLFAAYASLAATMMLFRSMANDIIPPQLISYLTKFFNYFFTPSPSKVTIIVDESTGMTRNHVFDSAEIYLGTKLSPDATRFKVNKNPRQNNINVTIAKNEEVKDSFQNIQQLTWRFVSVESDHSQEKKYFELSFDKQFKEKVVNEYLPFVIEKAKQNKDNDRAVRLYTQDRLFNDEDKNNVFWGSITLEHPSTFDTLAMEPDLKKALIDDLDRFVRRRDFYKKVGKAWKRGYLLYGPPGTGKSSLVAAMANYLKFDIYDLELTSCYSNSELRRVLVSTTNRSIVVIEDIDCSVETHDRNRLYGHNSNVDTKLTLSGLLNFIDGLWSSCGDERIIVFTTNHKDKLDPALLRPGRMDMHIHMSYCTFNSFKTLAYNYLGITDYPKLFGEIEGLIENLQVTPAEIAEELMRNEVTEGALQGVINLLLLKQKTAEDEAEAAKAKDNLEEANVIEEEQDVDKSESSIEAKRLNTERIVNHAFNDARIRRWTGGRGRGRGRGRRSGI